MQGPDTWEPEYPEYVDEGVPPSAPHSGLGIASFIIALVTGTLLVIAMVFAGIMAAAAGGDVDDEAPAMIAVGCFIILGVLAHLLGLGLGIAGLVQRDRRRVFAALGMVLNGVAVLGVLALMAIGLAAGAGMA